MARDPERCGRGAVRFNARGVGNPIDRRNEDERAKEPRQETLRS